MGPILIFDKSALQCLGIDEAVWLDNFFLSNITPLFYIETLADLSLPNPPRSVERIISEIAIKTPRAQPNIHHSRLVLGNLLGQDVEMSTGRPVLDRGVIKKSPDGKIGVHYEESAESIAMNRWYNREYLQIEREFAKQWRETLETMNFDTALSIVKNLLPVNHKLNSLEQVKLYLDIFVHGNYDEILLLLMDFLGIPETFRKRIMERWRREPHISIEHFAPYASYVFKIDLFFYISALRGFISASRHSNKIDMSYLYYLPFCHVFLSGDKLHQKTVCLFKRDDQSFVSATDFKSGLDSINKYYLQFKNEIEEKGVMMFAPYPPLSIESEIHKLWDVHCPKWRESALRQSIKPQPKIEDQKADEILLTQLNKVNKESNIIDPSVLQTMDDADYVIVKHKVPVQKGSWRILPKGIEKRDI